jgi:hypothetical protein
MVSRAEAGLRIDPAEDFERVGLLALGAESSLPRAAAGQLGLNLLMRKGVSRGTPVHDHADTAPVGLAESGDPKAFTRGVACHAVLDLREG